MYMIYILEELQTQPSIVDINELKSIAVLLTSDGLQRPADDPVHFSFAYSGLNLSAMLSGERWLQSDCLNLPFLSDDQFFCCYSVLGCIPENFGNFWSKAFYMSDTFSVGVVLLWALCFQSRFWIRNWSHISTHLVCCCCCSSSSSCWGNALHKTLRLSPFKSDRDEIW